MRARMSDSRTQVHRIRAVSDQGVVAGVVTERVVDRLEVVQVEVQQDHAVAAPHELALLLGEHEKAAPVGEAGELVGDRQLLELPAQLRVLGHVPQRHQEGLAVAPGRLDEPQLDDRRLAAGQRQLGLADGGEIERDRKLRALEVLGFAAKEQLGRLVGKPYDAVATNHEQGRGS